MNVLKKLLAQVDQTQPHLLERMEPSSIRDCVLAGWNKAMDNLLHEDCIDPDSDEARKERIRYRYSTADEIRFRRPAPAPVVITDVKVLKRMRDRAFALYLVQKGIFEPIEAAYEDAERAFQAVSKNEPTARATHLTGRYE